MEQGMREGCAGAAQPFNAPIPTLENAAPHTTNERHKSATVLRGAHKRHNGAHLVYNLLVILHLIPPELGHAVHELDEGGGDVVLTARALGCQEVESLWHAESMSTPDCQ